MRMPDNAFAFIETTNAMFIPLHADDRYLYCWPVYAEASVAPAVPASIAFQDRSWIRISVMPYGQAAPILRRLPELHLLEGLGKICQIERKHVVRLLDARSDHVRSENTATLQTLSALLDVDIAIIGLTGSTLYRPAKDRSDVDFVVYGECAAKRAYQRIARLLPNAGGMYMKAGQPQHWRFKIPGSDVWYDPRFVAAESLTQSLVGGGCRYLGIEGARGIIVIDDSLGIFYPSRYFLADGTVLLSYRLGHNGLFRAGDTLTLPPLPMFEIDGVTYRVSLKQDFVDKEAA